MQPTKTGYAPVKDLKIYYERYGAGKPLVLIHGGGSTIASNFARLIPLLAKDREIIAVELQAHGHTADRSTPESFTQDAEDVKDLLNHLNIDRADMLGFSNGGQTAMQMGISYPGLVDKLVIIGAFYKREGAQPWLWEGMPHATLDNMPKPLQQAYLAIADNDQQGLQTMFERDRDRMINFQDWKDEQVASIKAPTLILIGNQDVATPEHAVAMSKIIPNAQLVVLPGPHGACIGDVCTEKPGDLPAISAKIIESFLNE